MSNYSESKRVTGLWFGDGPLSGARITPTKVVVHTTEGTTLPDYEHGAMAPTYTAVPDFTAEKLEFVAHFDDEESARALKNLFGGVETNTDDCVQIELVGTCSPASHAAWAKYRHIYWPEAPEWALLDLAEFVVDMNKRHNISTTSTVTWVAYPKSYGQSAAQRLSGTAWTNYKGWLGHQHVPENDHGDPGQLDWAKLEGYVNTLMAPEPKISLVDQAVVHLQAAVDLLGKAKQKSSTPRPGLTVARQALRQVIKSLKKSGGTK